VTPPATLASWSKVVMLEASHVDANEAYCRAVEPASP